jgi:hypothetical protein
MLRNTTAKLLLLSFLFQFLSACEPSQVQEALKNSEFDLSTKVSIMDASSSDISEHVVNCKSNKEKQVCILICHRPPGNPFNWKTKVLPLKAAHAHLNHGHSSEEADFLGSCPSDATEGDESHDDGHADDGDSNNDDADSGSGDGSNSEDSGSGSDEGSGDGSSDSGGLNPDEELAKWCEENLNIDPNCDGINDNTGVVIY